MSVGEKEEPGFGNLKFETYTRHWVDLIENFMKFIGRSQNLKYTFRVAKV